MEISGISTSVNTQGLASSPTSSGTPQPVARDRESVEAPREPLRGIRGRRGLALGILKQELRSALQAFFRTRYDSVAAYSRTAEPATPDDVAAQTLGAAKQVVAESPTKAAESLVSFREKVEQTATYVRESVGETDDDIEDVDDVVAKVEDGLEELEGQVANYREATASVLAVDTRTRQRSTIQIRTQEGDVVKLSLRRFDSLSATDVAYSDGEVSMTSTEVAVSSRSRMLMSVEGDLNESEMEAIRNVFAQAEMIAEEFFGGDIGAAFNVAQGFEFDTGQLTRVSLRFRMREVTNIAYAQASTVAPAVAAPAAPAVAAPDAPATAVAGTPTSEPAVTPVPVAEPKPAADEAISDQPAVAGVDQAQSEGSLVPGVFSALADFLEALSVFLQSVGEGFEAEAASASYSYHYSESFKLSLLKAVVHTIAPDDAEDAAANAGAIIDGVSEAGKSD